MNVLNNKIILACHAMLLASIPFFVACSDDNPFSNAEDNMEDIRHDASNKFYDTEEDYDTDDDYDDEYNCRYGISSHSDSWCCSNYGYQCKSTSSSSRISSSSTRYDYGDDYYYSSNSRTTSNTQFDYLTNSKTLNFTLTYYKQTVCTMEDKSSKTCNYSDGDPRISFEIEFIQSNGTKTTFSTKKDIDNSWFHYDDTGEWEGRLSFTATAPALTDTIKVCPTVVDVDAFFDDDMSSGYCYYIPHVGLLDYREITYQTDYANEKCDLKWEWYLY
ncbi:MAG: hypothetical protein IJ912_05290 [Fibrobacter sp.]|nr:hypothetical protein [Fibrobacter sp.]